MVTVDMVYTVGLVLNTLELLLLIVGSAFQLVLMVLVHRIKLFHRNFRFILTLTCVSYMLLFLTRLVTVPPMYAGYYPEAMYSKTLKLGAVMKRLQTEADFVHNCVMIIYSKGFLFLALGNFCSSTENAGMLDSERCMATYYAKTYEKTINSWKMHFGLLVVIVVSSVLVAYIYRLQWLDTHFIAYYLTVLGTISLIVVICLFNINRIMYLRGRVLMLSLSERYQIQENVATCKMLVPVTIMHTITQGIALGAIYWMVIKFEMNDVADFRLPSFTLDLSLAFSVFLMPVMVVLFDKHLRAQLKAMIGVQNRVFTEGRESANAVAKVYFNQLNGMWK